MGFTSEQFPIDFIDSELLPNRRIKCCCQEVPLKHKWLTYITYIFSIICHIAQWQLLTIVARSHRHIYLKICQQIRVMFTLRRRPLGASKPASGVGGGGVFDLVCFCLVATRHHKSLSGMNYCWRLERARSAKVSLLGLMSLPRRSGCC